LAATIERKAKACLARLEENLRLLERGRLEVPVGAVPRPLPDECWRTGCRIQGRSTGRARLPGLARRPVALPVSHSSPVRNWSRDTERL
jgi:hypothetical protein